MQNEEMNMDNKLRQLENQSLPDLSKQDTHWQAMKQMLAPVAAPAKPAGKFGVWKWLAAAGVAVALIWLAGELFSADHKDNNPVTNTTKAEPASAKEITTAEDTARITPIQDTIARPAEAPATNLVIGIKPQLPPKNKKVASIVTPPCPKCNTDWLNDPLPDTTATKQAANPKATLAAFFAQLEKPSQEFVVDNKRDTVLYGQDGTALLIPANTFNTNGKVTLVLKEYYSYEDIITNKLTTTSNGQQLITGGMIHLVAMMDGKEIDMKPSKSIKWFIPDTTQNIKEMQVFRGEAAFSPSSSLGGTENSPANATINWVPENRFFQSSYTSVRVLNLCDHPYKTRPSKKGEIATFAISKNPKISKEELEEQLKKKYHYSKVKLKTAKDRQSFFRRIFPFKRRYETVNRRTAESLAVGDSAWVSADIAKRYNLASTDTIISRYAGTVSNGIITNSIFRKVVYNGRGDSTVFEADKSYSIRNNSTYVSALSNKYSVDVTRLGWINCDRFYNDNREKIDFYVDVKDTARNYSTLLVFDKMKSMMAGLASGNRIIFSNIPVGVDVQVVSVGIKDGKPIAAMSPTKVSKTIFSGLKFEETTPVEFRQQAANLDKQN